MSHVNVRSLHSLSKGALSFGGCLIQQLSSTSVDSELSYRQELLSKEKVKMIKIIYKKVGALKDTRVFL